MLKPGDKVEVNQIWASGGSVRQPFRKWFRGYEFVRKEDGKATSIVKALDGTFAGCEIRFNDSDIRKEES